MTTIIPITEERYPLNPDAQEIEALYIKLRQDARRLSLSRGQYMGMARRSKQRCAELQQELEEFAQDAHIALQEKAKLNAIVAKYGEVFTAFETAGDELVAGMTEYDKGARPYQGGSPIARLMRACRAFVQAWKAAKDLSADIEDINNGLIQ